MTAWLLTRPAPEAARDAALLRERGIAAEAWPVLEREDLPWDEALAGAGLLLLTAASVVPAVRRAWDAWDPKPLIAAVGPATAAAAREAGFLVDLEAPGGVEALLRAVISAWDRLGAPRAVLWPTSAAGLERGEQTRALALLEAVARVRRVPVVGLRRLSDLDVRLRTAPAGARWVFASPSAVEALIPGLPIPSAVLCHGASTATAYARLRAPGWPAAGVAPPGHTVVDAVIAAESNFPPPSVQVYP